MRLKHGVKADTEQVQQGLEHIRGRTDAQGVAATASVEAGSPARKRQLEPQRAMRVDLRHMANERDAGENELNKGLLEIRWLECSARPLPNLVRGVAQAEWRKQVQRG